MKDVLNDDDHVRIIKSIVTQAGPDGIEEDELIRRTNVLAAHVRNWKTAGAMYQLYVTGQATLRLTDDESDVQLTIPPGRREAS
ncbi:hypothetical protein [Streptomyces zhihengii]